MGRSVKTGHRSLRAFTGWSDRAYGVGTEVGSPCSPQVIGPGTESRKASGVPGSGAWLLSSASLLR